MRGASCALRILDKCNIFRACWFIALTFSQPEKRKWKVGKLLTFQISRTKAKSNQTEWSNQYNKPTTHGALVLLLWPKHKREWSTHTYTHDWSVRLMHLQYVRTFCVHDTINAQPKDRGKREHDATNYTLSSTTTVTLSPILSAIFLPRVMCFSFLFIKM